MAAPTTYTRSYGFADFEAATPDDPKPGDQIDNELDNVSDALTSTQIALADVRRADGALVNDIVTRDAIGDDVFTALVTEVGSLLSWQGAWATTTAYVATNLVEHNGSSYVCVAAHTSGDFATDLSSGYWEVFAEKGATGAGSGDLVSTNNLSDVANADTSLSNLGGTTVGRAVFKAASTAAARTAIGAVAPTQTIYTTGSGTYTTPSGCLAILVECVGGGGGGGGVDGQGASTAAVGGDGGAGAYCRLLIASPAASYTYAVGAGGAGGAAGANAGSNGTATTFTDGGAVAVSAGGGQGANGHTGIAGTGAAGTGGGGGAPSGGDDFSVPGSAGPRRRLAGGIVHSFPATTASQFGRALCVLSDTSDGRDGDGPGDGGGGAVSQGVATNYAGGDGAAGILRITEFY